MIDAPIRDAGDTTTRAEWLTRLDEIGEEVGYFEPLGSRHWALFSDDTPTLLVTFENIGAIRGGSDTQMPMGQDIARRRGWSHLCVISDGQTWYRDPAVYGYFDRLVDDAFFEDFDRVVFYGAGQGAYAACAYSVTAPGATVLAVQPVATLDPSVTEWDDRFREYRRLCFTDRYGYAPDMTEGAGEVFVLYDPLVDADAMQTALFTRPHVTKLRCRGLGSAVEPALIQMGVMPELVTMACEGRVDPTAVYRLLRARRDHGPYLRNLLSRTDGARRLLLSGLVCRNVLNRMKAPRFRHRLNEIEEALDSLGLALPPRHT